MLSHEMRLFLHLIKIRANHFDHQTLMVYSLTG
nr:MAG TPA: hypothetical protein [Caudoviricetes sp.]